jgi:hypothetical protein
MASADRTHGRDLVQFGGRGRYMITDVSFTNPGSAGTSNGRLSSRFAKLVADAPFGMCVLTMAQVPAR